MASAIGGRILAAWRWTHRTGAGRWLFARLLARAVPYSASIHPQIEHLSPGEARVSVKDRREIRNHLGSVHAIALANLGELTSGLALTTALPDGIRAIVTELRIEFRKKARGTLTAASEADPPGRIDGPTEFVVHADIGDPSGDVVARVDVAWLLDGS